MLIPKKSHKTTPVPGAYKHMACASSFLVHNQTMSAKPNFPTKSTTQVLYSAMSYRCNQFWQTIWWWSMENLKQFQNSNPQMSCFWNLVPTNKKLAPIDKTLTKLLSSQRLLSINHLLNTWSLYLTQAQFQKPITFTTFLACIPPLCQYPASNPCKLIKIPYWKPVFWYIQNCPHRTSTLFSPFDTSRDLHCVFSSYHCIPKLHTKLPQKESLALAPPNLTTHLPCLNLD